MKLNMPLVTLLSGAALGVGVLVASMLSPSSASATSGYGATSPASPVPSASPTSSATTATLPPPASSAPATSAPATSPATSPATYPTVPGAQAGVPAKADYVGMVDGGGAAVAVSVHGDKAVAYLCNGHAVAAWFRGTAKAGMLDLTGKNGARLSVDYRKAKVAGFIVANGVQYTFSVRRVASASSTRRPPGLYEAVAVVKGVMIKAGWIVLPDGGQIGSVEYDPTSAMPPTAQAPVLDLATGTAQYDGVTLVASLISGAAGSGF